MEDENEKVTESVTNDEADEKVIESVTFSENMQHCFHRFVPFHERRRCIKCGMEIY